MATPDFVLALRARIGTDPLWLSGVTAVVLRGEGDEREVLLVRRADNGAWTPVTGIIDPGEDPADAAVRETLEEAAVHAVAERVALVRALPPTTYGNGDRSQYLDLVLRLRYVSGEPFPADGENTDARWFRLGALPDLSPSMRERIGAAASDEVAARFVAGGEVVVPVARPGASVARPAPGRSGAPVRVRRAGVEDAAALTRLRRGMLDAMGVPGLDDERWQADCTAWFRDRLARPGALVACVVDGPLPDGSTGPVACAVGDLQEHAPEPWNPSGLRGHVFNVSTEPSARRRGYARACVEAVMAWFLDETTVTRVGLAATEDGRGMYEALGFAEPHGHELVWRIER
ncbi:GNAT family N-acetyltransferase [Cellulomonas massiliensis]|uniref:GNAT family N-acetyltransferase n=1 Tax=Cellulomonas massiliensis TaxID=1465811 RepID=UPI00031893CE|nr:GNAT family N-acetyltransferase [Cellulomonas massiliensis]